MKSNEEVFLKLLSVDLMEVNFDTGEIVSYVSGKARVVGRNHSQGYISVSVGGKTILAHRLVWLAKHGAMAKLW